MNWYSIAAAGGGAVRAAGVHLLDLGVWLAGLPGGSWTLTDAAVATTRSDRYRDPGSDTEPRRLTADVEDSFTSVAAAGPNRMRVSADMSSPAEALVVTVRIGDAVISTDGSVVRGPDVEMAIEQPPGSTIFRRGLPPFADAVADWLAGGSGDDLADLDDALVMAQLADEILQRGCAPGVTPSMT